MVSLDYLIESKENKYTIQKIHAVNVRKKKLRKTVNGSLPKSI